MSHPRAPPRAEGSLDTPLRDRGPPGTPEATNEAFGEEAEGAPAGGLHVERQELVSTGFRSHPPAPRSSACPATLTVDGGRRAKTMARYDNEYGYPCRLADVCVLSSRSAASASARGDAGGRTATAADVVLG